MGKKIKADQVSCYNLLDVLVFQEPFYVLDIADQHSVELHTPEVPHFTGNCWPKFRLQ